MGKLLHCTLQTGVGEEGGSRGGLHTWVGGVGEGEEGGGGGRVQRGTDSSDS